MALHPQAHRLATAATYATVVTLMPDGTPQALPLWVDSDGEHLLLNTEPQRQRSKNVARDPRVTVLLLNPADPWDWAEVRGRVVDTVTGDEARAHINALSHKYLGSDYGNPIGSEGRVILKVAPDKVNHSKSA